MKIPVGTISSIGSLQDKTVEELEAMRAWLEPLIGLLSLAHGVTPNDPMLRQWKQDLADLDTEILERTLLK